VFDTYVVSAPEGGTVLIALGFGYWRMPELIAILYVRFAMIFEVFSGSRDSIVKATTADFVVVVWRGLPCLSAVLVMWPVLG